MSFLFEQPARAAPDTIKSKKARIAPKMPFDLIFEFEVDIIKLFSPLHATIITLIEILCNQILPKLNHATMTLIVAFAPLDEPDFGLIVT